MIPTAYDHGSAAYQRGEAYDYSKSQEWRNGWKAAQAADYREKAA